MQKVGPAYHHQELLQDMSSLGCVGHYGIQETSLFFENKLITATETISKAIRDTREWQQAQPNSNEQRRKSGTPVSPDTLVVFTDAAWDRETKRAGLSWISSSTGGITPSRNSTTVNFIP